MEPAVLELVDGAQVQVAELDELAHAREVEEAVAGDDARDVPEQPSRGTIPSGEDRAATGRPPGRPDGAQRPPGAGRARSAANADRAASTPSASQIVAVHGEDDGPGDEDARQGPRERRRRSPRCPSARATSRPGKQHDGRSPNASRRYSPITTSSARTSPEARKRGPVAVAATAARRETTSRAQAQRPRAGAAARARPRAGRGASRGSAGCPRRFST